MREGVRVLKNSWDCISGIGGKVVVNESWFGTR